MKYLQVMSLAGFLLLLGILLSVITIGLALPIALPLMFLGFVLLFMGLEKRLETHQTQGRSKKTRHDHWFSRINLVLGVWLIAAPFLLNYSVPNELTVEMYPGRNVNILVNPLWNNVIVGALISIFASVRAFDISRALVWSWANLGLGAWLVAAPFILSYAREIQEAFLTNVIVGLLVVGFSLASAAVMRPSSAQR
jgi:hypothetical protein